MRNLAVKIQTIGDTSGAMTVQQAFARTGQAARDAQTVTISTADAATAALRRQADAMRAATSTSGGGAAPLNINNPNNRPAAPALTGPTTSVNTATLSVQAVEAKRREAEATQRSTTATREETAASTAGNAAAAAKVARLAALTAAKNTNTTANASNTVAVLANTTALSANTTAMAVNARAIAADTTALNNNRAAQSNLRTSLSTVTTAFGTNARAAAADTTALAANTAAFRNNAAAVNAAAGARRNATAANTAARAAAAAAATAAQNTGGVSANTAALGANTAAMSPNVTARNRTTLATSRNTTAVTANTTALQANITMVAGQTASQASNSASKRANLALINLQNTALAGNTGLLSSNTAGLNANSGARNRNAGASRNAAQANNAFGLGMMQLAYFVDDLQYGLRGFINNIPLLLSSFGLSGGLAGAISILAVGIKVCIDHWHLFSGATSEAAKSARAATIEVFEAAKAASRAATDAENANTSWRNHGKVIEDAAIAYDKLKTNIDAATEAQRDADRQALEKEDAQAALDIANIEARQAEGNISDSDAVIQKREVQRRVARKKYEIERAALDQEERDALALSKSLEEQRQRIVEANRERNATLADAQKKFGITTFMNPEERKEAEKELEWMRKQLKEREQVVEDTWKAKLIWHERGPGELLPAPEIITNPAYTAAVNRANAYDDKVRAKQNQLDLDRLLQSATGAKGRKEIEEKNRADEAALRELDKKIAEARTPLSLNPSRRSTLETVFNLNNEELVRKSGTEITKIQERENQERNKDFEESQKEETKKVKELNKSDRAGLDSALDRIRARYSDNKSSGAYDRDRARNVTGNGSRRSRLDRIGAGKPIDRESLVNDYIKAGEALKDGIDEGEMKTLTNAAIRLAAGIEKRDDEMRKAASVFLEMARKLEQQQRNLRN